MRKLTPWPTLALLALMRSAAGAICDAPYNQLSSDCRDLSRSPTTVCLVVDNTDSPCDHRGTDPEARSCSLASSCDVAFYEPLVSRIEFKFFIAIDASERRLVEEEEGWGSVGNDTDDVTAGSLRIDDTGDDSPTELNRFVSSVGALLFPPFITDFLLCGGRESFGVKGTVAAVAIQPDMLTEMPQLKSIALANLNLRSQQTEIASFIPTQVVSLILRNTMLTAVPTGLSSLQQLTILNLDQNRIKTVPASLSLPQVTDLYVKSNAVSSFEAVLSTLSNLDLSDNALTTIPAAVFDMPKLSTLKLGGNPIAPVMLSNQQYTRLLKLAEFTIDGSASATIGDVPISIGSENVEIKPLHKINVAVVNDTKLSELSEVIASINNQTTTGSRQDSESESGNAELDAFAENDESGENEQGFSQNPAASDRDGDVSPPSPLGGPNGDGSSQSSTLSTASQTTILVVSAIVSAAIVLLVVAAFVHFRRSRGADHHPDTNEVVKTGTTATNESTPSTDSHPSPRNDYGSDVKNVLLSHRIPLAHLHDKEIIGKGTGSVVWLVQYRETKLLASKRRIHSQASTRITDQLINEIMIVANLSHPSIVEFVGAAWTNKTNLQALYEYMPSGDLQSFLASTKQQPTDWDAHKLRLAMDIVEALVYSHSFDPPLLHRDLTSRAVLLTASCERAKLSHFGSARYESDDGTMTTTGVGSMRWQPPEILTGDKSYSASSDVYALGVVLSELDTHAVPYEDVCSKQGVTELALVQLVTVEGVRPSLHDACPSPIRRLVYQCLQSEPASRPSAVDVVFALRNFASVLEESEI